MFELTSPFLEAAIAQQMLYVLNDKPTKVNRWTIYLWHRRWRKEEYMLFCSPMSNTTKWFIVKEALNRIGGFW